eukprot:scaffold65008_cov31-Tisochrysis_lutea.AAC.1
MQSAHTGSSVARCLHSFVGLRTYSYSFRTATSTVSSWQYVAASTLKHITSAAPLANPVTLTLYTTSLQRIRITCPLRAAPSLTRSSRRRSEQTLLLRPSAGERDLRRREGATR